MCRSVHFGLALGFAGGDSELERHGETLPDLTDCGLLGRLFEAIVDGLARFDLGAGEHAMAEEAVLAGVRAECLVLLLEIGAVAEVVHRVVAWFLLVHGHDSRSITVL